MFDKIIEKVTLPFAHESKLAMTIELLQDETATEFDDACYCVQVSDFDAEITWTKEFHDHAGARLVFEMLLNESHSACHLGTLLAMNGFLY